MNCFEPEVSVVIAARNAAKTIGEQLDALSRQVTTIPFVVIVVDDHSSDATRDVVEGFRCRFPSLTVIAAVDGSGQSHAANVGVRHSLGPSLIFVDADDVVCESYVQAMGSALRETPWVGGMREMGRLNPRLPAGYAGLQSAITDGMYGWLPWISGSAIGMRRKLFESLGGFDEDLASGMDVDLGWKASLRGVRPELAQGAILHYRLRRGLRPNFSRHRVYGRGNPLLYRRYRQFGLPRRSSQAVARFWLGAVGACLRCRTLGDVEGCAAMLGFRLGLLEGSIRYRAIYL
ncbi:MAG: glycosyltransferase [Acidimicrobiales bacterium]